MEYDEEDTGASGSIPEFGAIFMSNVQTKKECFERKIFALPSSKAEFVKHIKAGMVLFLFESNKRQLFGVYQASSDGSTDIVPHAFSNTGKRFPAQVCFTPLWHCDPLSEKEFRDAIRENYFSAKKFNFGLSEDQVHRLLYLFSSRKLKHKMPPHPRSEAIVGAAGEERSLVDANRLSLSERGCIDPTDYEESSPAAFCDHRVNSFARAKENEVLIDDGVNSEGDFYPFPEDEFLAKRRIIGNVDRSLRNDVAENRSYSHGTLRTFCIDSSKDMLDEVRRLADTHRLLTVEKVNENQVDKIHNPVLSSEYQVDPLDARANDDYRFMQRSRLFDECNLQNGSGQSFTNVCYEKSSDKSLAAIYDNRSLLDDCVKRDHDTVKPRAYGNGDLNLCRKARDIIDGHDYLMNRKLENRYHLDRYDRPFSAVEHSSLLDKTRETTAARRFPINESEPDFSSCYMEDSFSEKFPGPMQHGHRISYDRKYQTKEGKLTESMIDKILPPATLAKDAGYIASFDRRVVDDGRFRKIDRVDIKEDSHGRTNPVMSMEYPSFSHPKQNLSSFSDNLLAEKKISKLALSHNFDPFRSAFDDATVATAAPYSPEHPSLSHGISLSIAAKPDSSLVEGNHPPYGSLGNYYSPSKNRSQLCLSGLEKFSRPLDTATEFVNNGFRTSTPGCESSLIHGSSSSSFVNSDLSMHKDLNTCAPVNYKSSLFSKLCPPFTDFENIEGEKGLFAYPSKSRENHFKFDGNFTVSQHVSKNVGGPEMDMLAGKDFNYSKAKDFGLGACHPKRDLASHDNQYFKFSSNMNLKELHKISGAPHDNFNGKRRSVFARLSSGEESQFSEERNDIDFNHHDCCMDATADEVMKMLRQGDNLSLRKLRKSRGGRQPTHGKKIKCHMETNHSTMGKKKLNDASLAAADSMDEVPKETRMLDFKRRSDTKILVGISADSDAHNKITGANEEAKVSMKINLKRKKLVRPAFSKIESATDVIDSNRSLQIPALILDKDYKQSCETAISFCEAGMLVVDTHSSNVLASYSHRPMGCDNKEHQNIEELKDVVANVLPSTSNEFKEHKTINVDLQIGSSEVLKETKQKSSGI